MRLRLCAPCRLRRAHARSHRPPKKFPYYTERLHARRTCTRASAGCRPVCKQSPLSVFVVEGGSAALCARAREPGRARQREPPRGGVAVASVRPRGVRRDGQMRAADADGSTRRHAERRGTSTSEWRASAARASNAPRTAATRLHAARVARRRARARDCAARTRGASGARTRLQPQAARLTSAFHASRARVNTATAQRHI